VLLIVRLRARNGSLGACLEFFLAMSRGYPRTWVSQARGALLGIPSSHADSEPRAGQRGERKSRVRSSGKDRPPLERRDPRASRWSGSSPWERMTCARRRLIRQTFGEPASCPHFRSAVAVYLGPARSGADPRAVSTGPLRTPTLSAFSLTARAAFAHNHATPGHAGRRQLGPERPGDGRRSTALKDAAVKRAATAKTIERGMAERSATKTVPLGRFTPARP
jgi:hypothetical protein